MNLIRWAAVAALLCFLTACSNKPPGCADAEVADLMRSMVLDDETGDGKTLRALDAKGIVPKYVEAAKVTLSNTVSDGYNEQAKRLSCKANVAVKFPDGKGWTKEIPFTTQLTVDGGKFVLEAAGIDELTLLARKAIKSHYLETRWGGTWSGAYACSGLDGEISGPRGPFNMNVELVVDGQRAKLERLTAGGGVETLEGWAPALDGSFSIEGRGRNAGDDQWQMELKFQADGDTLVGTGTSTTVSLVNRRALRNCTVKLTRGGVGSAAVAAVPEAVKAGWPGTYVGDGDGEVTLVVQAARSDKQYPVSMSTNTAKTGGGCGGSVDGLATESGDELRIVAQADGQRCEATVKRQGAALELMEGQGCNYFHGAACGFSATLRQNP